MKFTVLWSEASCSLVIDTDVSKEVIGLTHENGLFKLQLETPLTYLPFWITCVHLHPGGRTGKLHVHLLLTVTP